MIFHSDRGTQYCQSQIPPIILKSYMDRVKTKYEQKREICWDNAVADHSLKAFKG